MYCYSVTWLLPHRLSAQFDQLLISRPIDRWFTLTQLFSNMADVQRGGEREDVVGGISPSAGNHTHTHTDEAGFDEEEDRDT